MRTITILIAVGLIVWLLGGGTRGFSEHGTRVLTDRCGLAQLTLPAGWRATTGLNESADMQADHTAEGRYVITISEPLDDFAGIDVERHSQLTREILTESVTVEEQRGPELVFVAGMHGVQFEIDAVADHVRVRYIHTTLAGKRAFHQVIAWASRSRYNRAAFQVLVDGFRELPQAASGGCEPENGGQSGSDATPIVTPASDYGVH